MPKICSVLPQEKLLILLGWRGSSVVEVVTVQALGAEFNPLNLHKVLGVEWGGGRHAHIV